MIIDILLVVSTILFSLGLYGMYMNEVVLKERLSMLPEPGDPDFWGKMKRLKSVSYDEHFWVRFTLRDPMKLYEEHDRENRSSE